MPETIDVALAGVGDVGQAVLERVHETGARVRVVAACDTTGAVVDPEGLNAPALVAAKREEGSVGHGPGATRAWTPREMAAKAPAHALVQATPTNLDDPSASVAAIEAALAAGSHVVTAAKDALACAPERVHRLEVEHPGTVRSGAAIAGSTPLLETIEGAFAGDTVERAEALLNGSTTFLLSAMEQGTPREEALREAREAGILEADPTLDLTGRDAAAKAAILHQALYGSTLSLADVEVQGLGGIAEADCLSAARRGFAIRLAARVDPDGARVAPVELPREHPLAIDGTDSCIRLQLEGAGPIQLRGPGAGPRETASALLSDVLGLRGSTAPDRRPRARSAALSR